MTAICTFEGCGRPHKSHGLCSTHYKQEQKGFQLSPIKVRKSTRQGLRAHADWSGDECLTWPFKRTDKGYPLIKGGSAARRMCILAHGEPPFEKAEAAHSCGKGHEGCVNPKHLRWATRQENVDDMIVHGTRLKGESISWARLTENDVREIRATHKRRMSPKPFMEKYGISASTLYEILRRDIWRHV